MNKLNFATMLGVMASLTDSLKRASAATRSYSDAYRSKRQGEKVYRGRTVSKKVAKRLHNEKLTNHQRVTMLRANRMGMTHAEYLVRFPRGYQA